MFGLKPIIPIILGLITVGLIIWCSIEYCLDRKTKGLKIIFNHFLGDFLANTFICGIICLFIIIVLGIINYMVNTTSSGTPLDTYQTKGILPLVPCPTASDKYVIYDEETNQYTYYIKEFENVTEKVVTGNKIIVLPILSETSTISPQETTQVCDNRHKYNTTPFSNKDTIIENGSDSTVTILIIPIDGLSIQKNVS